MEIRKYTSYYQLIEAELCISVSVNKPIFGSDYGLSPVRRQAIIWNNADLLFIGTLGTNFNEIWIGI